MMSDHFLNLYYGKLWLYGIDVYRARSWIFLDLSRRIREVDCTCLDTITWDSNNA